MRTAFAASGVVAVRSGVVGFFLVMRGQTFAGHALSHVGFTGATGAVLVGVSPLWGLIGFTVLSGFAVGTLGEKLSGRDVAIGMMLSLALGLGLLFLHFYTAYASQATALLFGNVLGVSNEALATLTGLTVVSLVALGAIARPLIFASLQPELAEAKGVPVRMIATEFLMIVAIAVAECAQIVGVLLVFTLMVGPSAAAQRFTRHVGVGVDDSLRDSPHCGGGVMPSTAAAPRVASRSSAALPDASAGRVLDRRDLTMSCVRATGSRTKSRLSLILILYHCRKQHRPWRSRRRQIHAGRLPLSSARSR